MARTLDDSQPDLMTISIFLSFFFFSHRIPSPHPSLSCILKPCTTLLSPLRTPDLASAGLRELSRPDTMSTPFESTTPTPQSLSKSKSTSTARPTGSLVPSPAPNRRVLTYGSAMRDGYGVVSAAGLNAWRRGPRRDRTASASTSEKGIRRGLGMGMESTPGRKKFKRFNNSTQVRHRLLLNFRGAGH